VDEAALERWRASLDNMDRIKKRIREIAGEQWSSYLREPPDTPVGLNAEKRPAAVIDEGARWVDAHPHRSFVIIIAIISLFYLLLGGFVGRG
jgi:hypothetical protein